MSRNVVKLRPRPLPVKSPVKAKVRRQRMTNDTICAVAILLARVLRATGEHNGATVYGYIDGYSDESVAKEIGRNCTVAHLVRYRQKSLGRIESEVKWPKPATATSTPTGLETRLDSLAERVAALEASIGG